MTFVPNVFSTAKAGEVFGAFLKKTRKTEGVQRVCAAKRLQRNLPYPLRPNGHLPRPAVEGVLIYEQK